MSIRMKYREITIASYIFKNFLKFLTQFLHHPFFKKLTFFKIAEPSSYQNVKH